MTEATHPGRRAGTALSLAGALSLLLASAGGTFAAPDIAGRLDQYGLDLAAANPGDGIAYFRMIDADLQTAGSSVPGLDLARLTGELTTDALAAELDEQAGLASLQRVAALPNGAFSDAAAAMIRPLFDLAHSGPENPEGLRNLGKAVERLAAGGIGLSDLSGLKPDEYLKIVEQAAKWTKAAADLATLQQTGALNAKQFTDDVLSALPPQIAPGLASPAGKLFRDLMDWDQQMWTASTDGLDLVSRAISDGKLDTAAYDKLAKRLQQLAQQGPWTTQSGIDFAKKMAEGVPTAGKLLKALWSSAGKATPGLPATGAAVPLTTQSGGQLPPQTFSFSLGAGGSITVTSSPGYQVYGQGGVRVEFVKISPDALPGYLVADATTVAGGGGEEAHRWQVYPEQQVVAVTVDYDTGTATAVPSGFGDSAEPPMGATRVTGINVTFYPLGATVVLHWPADIPF